MSQRLTLQDIEIGQTYEHILNNDYVLVIEKGNEQVKIRTKSFADLYVYPWELRHIGNGGGYNDNYGGGWNNGPRNGVRNGGYNNGPRNRW